MHQCRRLPVLLETFLGSFPCLLVMSVRLIWLDVLADEVKLSFQMIEYESGEYMTRYEVR